MRLWEQYLQPASLTEALTALQSAAGCAAVIAGGTDLLLDLEQGRHAPVDTLVDVSMVAEMLELREVGDFIHIGAAVPLRDVIHDPVVRANAAALVEACELIGGPQVRNVATLGGNVAHALPAGDGTIALLALGAEAELASAQGVGWVPIEELFASPGVPRFDRKRQLIVRFRIPAIRPNETSAFRRVMRPQGVAIAILNLAARLRFNERQVILEARIAIGPAGPRPLRPRATERAIEGRVLDPATIEGATQALAQEVSLRTSPHRATVQYRRHLLGTLLEQTLRAALERTGRA